MVGASMSLPVAFDVYQEFTKRAGIPLDPRVSTYHTGGVLTRDTVS